MDKAVYGRAIIIKNCGRFLNIASDFGSEYKTHPFLTEQMVYAGLTRENELIEDKKLKIEKSIVPDKYDFNDRYKIPNGRYFTCAYIINQKKYKEEQNIELWNKNRDNSDVNDFNSIAETNAGVQDNNKLPKFGNIESILPNNYFITFAFSMYKDYLEKYYNGQTFYMGKKRTMFQIEKMSDIVQGNSIERESKLFLPIQINQDEVEKFGFYSIITVTQRYILLKGKTKKIINIHWPIDFNNLKGISLPAFYSESKIGG